MSLNISTYPAKTVVNAPEFKVTTSLVEGASYNNLRVRATVYLGGKDAPVAVLEQPKGLTDWDFSDLLKTFIGRMNVAVGGSDLHVQPTLSAELLTGWTAEDSLTLTSSGRTISDAYVTPDYSAYARSNDLGAVSVGDVVIIGMEHDFTSTGGNDVLLFFGTQASLVEELAYITLGANKVFFHVVSEDNATPTIRLGNGKGS
jgi:hypothetical protein